MASVRSHLRTALRNILYISAVKKSLETIPVVQKVYAPAQRTHPIDRIYGIDTSGVVPVEKLHPDPNLQSLIIPYAGSQPSIVRRALSTLGSIWDYAFIDLGCGKGRVTTVASEFPFLEVIGVGLSAALAAHGSRQRSCGRAPISESSASDDHRGECRQFSIARGQAGLL